MTESNGIIVDEDDDFFKPVSATTSAVEHPKPEDDFATPVTHTEEPKAPLTVTEQAVLNKISALTTNDSAAVTTNGTAAPSGTRIRSKFRKVSIILIVFISRR